jgi:translocon-associated protein subunit gamma
VSVREEELNYLIDMASKAKQFTREEELLLQDFSRNVSTKSNALFYGNAFIVSAIPIWLFWRIHLMDIITSSPIFILVTLASTWLMAFAYRNTKFSLKHKVAVKREEAVTLEMNRRLADDKKMSKKEKDERILWKRMKLLITKPPLSPSSTIMLCSWLSSFWAASMCSDPSLPL